MSVCGKAFWLKGPLRAFLVSTGVPGPLYDRYGDESKFKIARNVLAELDRMGEEGVAIQRKIVTELAKLRRVPDDTVPNREAAVEALNLLKQLARDHRLLVEEERSAADERIREARRKQAAVAERAKKVAELRVRFMGMATSNEDPAARGFGLEDLLAELFEVNEISYRRSYRTATEQIDGCFDFKGFDYLVEARWRQGQPIEADLAVLKTKVDKKLTSTRGLFVSIPGFRTEVVLEFTRGISANIVLMDGADLMLILEGHIPLTDALDLKVQKAAQEGMIYFPLAQRFSK